MAINIVITKPFNSVYPVFDKSPDNLLGTVSVSQIFTESLTSAAFNLSSLIKAPLYVHENMAAYKVLESFKQERAHLVFVVDEYGSLQGILSVTDLVDALIGEVSTDIEEPLGIVQSNENSWLADGQYTYHEFVEYFNISDAEEPESLQPLGY